MELTEEQRKDVQERQKQFMEKYEALTIDLQMDFATSPQFVPMGQGVWGVSMFPSLTDKKYLTPLSPIQQ